MAMGGLGRSLKGWANLSFPWPLGIEWSGEVSFEEKGRTGQQHYLPLKSVVASR